MVVGGVALGCDQARRRHSSNSTAATAQQDGEIALSTAALPAGVERCALVCRHVVTGGCAKGERPARSRPKTKAKWQVDCNGRCRPTSGIGGGFAALLVNTVRQSGCTVETTTTTTRSLLQRARVCGGSTAVCE